MTIEKTQNIKLNNSRSNSLKTFFSKLSGAFMLPISVLSAVGIFLGFGEVIASNFKDSNDTLYIFGKFLSSIGTPVFACMPVLFGMAIAVSFTGDEGTAVFATLIGYITFSSIQGTFILEKDKGFVVLFEGWARNPEDMKPLITNALGYQVLNTSLFSGLIIGFIVTFLHYKFKEIQLPSLISFFAGKRFVSISAIFSMVPLAFAFLILWPYVGSGISQFGNLIAKSPLGIDSFLFGFIERTLIPFGLHHVTNGLFQKTSVGGNVLEALTKFVKDNPNNSVAAKLLKDLSNIKESITWGGDIFDWRNIYIYAPSELDGVPIYQWISDNLGINLGRFSQGKYQIMMFGLPAAGAAMIFAAKGENRKVALATVLPASATSFLTGITEPIEFTFLFLAPWLFFGFHAIMAGFSFMLLNIFGAHMGLIEFGSVVEFIINGILPMAKGTKFWIGLIVGFLYIPIYFGFFYFAINYFDLQTPGRGQNIGTLFTKKDYQNKLDSTSSNPKIDSIVEALGGYENITKFENCASRLRYDVKDSQKVSESQLKANGAFGVIIKDKHVQVIFGPAAEQTNMLIIKNIPEKLKKDKK